MIEHEPRATERETVEDLRESRPKGRSRRLLVAGIVAVLVAGAVIGVAQDPDRFGFDWIAAQDPDADGDGLSDEIERAGWLTSDQELHQTDANVADSDGDGLEDGDEADFDLDPNERDSDGDGIEDGREVHLVGTSASLSDTDGDGFDDVYEYTNSDNRGLDPLVADVKVSKTTYATDFAIGSLAGDAWRKDSLAWMAGNLASGGSSAIPVIGWVVGAIADLRDAIASAIRGDWVGSGFSAIGVVPYGGDAAAIPGKAAKFASRNPGLTTSVAAAIVAIPKVSDDIKFRTVRTLHPGSADLLKAGASKKTLLRLAAGRTNLDALAAAVKRPGHVVGAPAQFLADGPSGEKYLERVVLKKATSVTTQVSASTKECIRVCNATLRRFDAVADGIAHEAKVGFKYLTSEMKMQIRSDVWARKNGEVEGVHWHFFASGHTDKVGASESLLEYLEKYDIPYTIHLPARA